MNINSRVKKNNCSVVISTVVNSRDFSNTLKLMHVFAISFEKMFAMSWVYFQIKLSIIRCLYYLYFYSVAVLHDISIYYRLTCV